MNVNINDNGNYFSQKTDADNNVTQNKLNAMNTKVIYLNKGFGRSEVKALKS